MIKSLFLQTTSRIITITSRNRESRSTPSFFAEDEKKSGRKTPVRIMSLGGVNEIGKNIYVYECCNDIFIIDCGLAFPDDDMLSVLTLLSPTSPILKRTGRR